MLKGEEGRRNTLVIPRQKLLLKRHFFVFLSPAYLPPQPPDSRVQLQPLPASSPPLSTSPRLSPPLSSYPHLNRALPPDLFTVAPRPLIARSRATTISIFLTFPRTTVPSVDKMSSSIDAEQPAAAPASREEVPTHEEDSLNDELPDPASSDYEDSSDDDDDDDFQSDDSGPTLKDVAKPRGKPIKPVAIGAPLPILVVGVAQAGQPAPNPPQPPAPLPNPLPQELTELRAAGILPPLPQPRISSGNTAHLPDLLPTRPPSPPTPEPPRMD